MDNSSINQTTVTIIGTFHGAHRELNYYTTSKLNELLTKSMPEVLALEIRPEDYIKADDSKNPWDMNTIFIPFGKNNQLPLEPIDWWPDDMRSEHEKFLTQLRKTPDGIAKLIEIEDEWAPHKEIFPDLMSVTPEYVHSDEFAKRDSIYRLQLTENIGEGPQNLWWYTRAKRINDNIEHVLAKYPGKRITIVVGAFHRNDIEKFLKEKNVTLVSINSLDSQ